MQRLLKKLFMSELDVYWPIYLYIILVHNNNIILYIHAQYFQILELLKN